VRRAGNPTPITALRTAPRVLLIAALWVATASLGHAQPPPAHVVPPPGTAGTYVLVPRAGGYVYVPLDASGMPTGIPGVGPGSAYPDAATPPAHAAPRAPSIPPAPVLPPAPGAAHVGYLQTEIEPLGAEVFIDGRRAGPADPPGAARTLFALETGMHRVEITRPGFRPLRTEIRIAPRVTFAIRGRLEPN